VIRANYLFEYHFLSDWTELTVDNWYHWNWAQTMVDGNLVGDTTYFRAPFYVYCLALVKALFGDSLWAARLFGTLTGLASVWLTFLLGQRLFNRRAGLVAASLHALYPVLIYFESELLLDSLFMLLVQIAVYRFLIWLESEEPRDVFYVGLTCSLAAITRPTILVAVPLFLLMIVWICRRSDYLRQAILFVVGLALFVGPVFARNLVVAGDPVLISSQAGVNLFIGNNPEADGFTAALPEPMGRNWQLSQIEKIAEDDLGRQLKPGELSTYWRGKAVDWTMSNPGRFAELYATKALFQIDNREVSNNRQMAPFFAKIAVLKYNPLSFGIILPFAILGFILGIRGNKGLLFVLILIALYIVVVSLFFYNSRFRLPLMPFYLVAAAGGVTGLIQGVREKRRAVFVGLAIAIPMAAFSFCSPVKLPQAVSTDHLVSHGLHLFEQQEYRAALEQFQEVVRLDNDLPEANLNMGSCFFRMGLGDSAEVYYRREIARNPKRHKAYQNLASLKLVNGEYGDAQEWIQRAIALSSYDVQSNLTALRAYAADTGTTDEELASVAQTAVIRTDGDLHVLNEAATVCSRRGLYDMAYGFLLQGLSASPPSIETDDQAFGRGFRHDKASTTRERARTYYQLGYLGGIRGDFELAIGYCRRAIDADSTLVEAYVNLVTAYLSSGRQAEADWTMDIADEKFPNHPLVRQLQERLGR